MPPQLILIIIIALIFDLMNGMNDSSNIVATVVSSRELRPRAALAITAAAEFCGPLLIGVAVATTVGSELVSPGEIDLDTILTALITAIAWNTFSRLVGIPTSSSHALLGGILGAVIIDAGFGAIHLAGFGKILFALFVSPVIGFIVGFLVMRLVHYLSRNASPRINLVYKRSQIFTSIFLGLSHGANDAQKTMGVITLALVIAGVQSQFKVPLWVILLCSGMIAIGTSIGSTRLIKTLGYKFYKIRPIHGFSAQMSSATVILVASLLGGPVSTTQVMSSAIMGVGASDRPSKVHWAVGGEIITAWLITIPATMIVSGSLYWMISKGFPWVLTYLPH